MLNKELKFGNTAKHEMLKGIKILYDAVSTTLGPKGNCVVLVNNNGTPKVTKDGVSVAKEIYLRDAYQNVGAQLVKEAAIKTLSAVGDATTTSTILAYNLIKTLMPHCEDNVDIVSLKKGIDIAVEQCLDYIKQHTIQITDNDIKNIATISANNDIEIGTLIAEAFAKIGRDGVITVEESNNIQTTTNVITGMRFDRGYIASHFVTDTIKDQCILDNPYVLITELKVNSMIELAPVLNEVVKSGKSILLIADDFDSEVIETLKVNKLQGVLKVCAIKAPSFGKYRKELLDDIACITGGLNVSYDTGMDLQDVTIGMLGKLNKVIVTKTNTTLIGNDNTTEVERRVAQLRNELNQVIESPEMDSSFMIDFIKERIAKLTGGICTIYVGGTTELEMKERRDRVDDAVSATQAAIESGVVCGGGLTYFNAAKSIHDYDINDEDVLCGINAIKSTLLYPITMLCNSAGLDIEKHFEEFTATIGFDANNECFVNMYESGIIDPAKSAILALQNAVSVAKLFLSTDCIIVPEITNNLITM